MRHSMSTTLVDRILANTGYQNRSAIERVVELTVDALACQLAATGHDLASILPDVPTKPAAEGALPQTPDPLYGAVAAELNVRPGVALELVQTTVAEVIAGALPVQREQLRADLPAAWAALIVEPRPPSIYRPAPKQPVGGTLATGRPGSDHPLSDSRPSGGHANSIAETDDPHADRLSSAGDPDRS